MRPGARCPQEAAAKGPRGDGPDSASSCGERRLRHSADRNEVRKAEPHVKPLPALDAPVLRRPGYVLARDERQGVDGQKAFRRQLAVESQLLGGQAPAEGEIGGVGEAAQVDLGEEVKAALDRRPVLAGIVKGPVVNASVQVPQGIVRVTDDVVDVPGDVVGDGDLLPGPYQAGLEALPRQPEQPAPVLVLLGHGLPEGCRRCCGFVGEVPVRVQQGSLGPPVVRVRRVVGVEGGGPLLARLTGPVLGPLVVDVGRVPCVEGGGPLLARLQRPVLGLLIGGVGRVVGVKGGGPLPARLQPGLVPALCSSESLHVRCVVRSPVPRRVILPQGTLVPLLDRGPVNGTGPGLLLLHVHGLGGVGRCDRLLVESVVLGLRLGVVCGPLVVDLPLQLIVLSGVHVLLVPLRPGVPLLAQGIEDGDRLAQGAVGLLALGLEFLEGRNGGRLAMLDVVSDCTFGGLPKVRPGGGLLQHELAGLRRRLGPLLEDPALFGLAEVLDVVGAALALPPESGPPRRLEAAVDRVTRNNDLRKGVGIWPQDQLPHLLSRVRGLLCQGSGLGAAGWSGPGAAGWLGLRLGLGLGLGGCVCDVLRQALVVVGCLAGIVGEAPLSGPSPLMLRLVAFGGHRPTSQFFGLTRE